MLGRLIRVQNVPIVRIAIIKYSEKEMVLVRVPCHRE